ncbi:citrate synthase/methylcitrate synthase [Evansella halocellulosilytica]|uniref:citrate synthase/methylcitrate synthase n=1 Tax=Evansella halocellulosilytica TaxID=2011013 RepID=UPI000BB6A041|nr:citrate synthase/methylcitrate synthase [Evansella halocellulosilytica]
MEGTINKGLAGVIASETKISFIDGKKGSLIYRGHWAKKLAVTKEFEEICYLLWHGKLPNELELANLKRTFHQYRKLPTHIKEMIHLLPKSMSMMSVLRTCISAMGDDQFQWPPTVDEAMKVTAVLPTIITSRQQVVRGEEVISPHDSLDHVANYLYMMTGQEPVEAHVKALNAYFILTMEHGMNASTFASRVVASTESDLSSAITGAIGAMKGPLHGGAPSEVTSMLESIGTKDQTEAWLRKKLRSGEKLMGFGHRIYKTSDPRAEALKQVTSQLTNEDPWLDLANHVERTAIRLLEEYKPGRKLYTNVEFYAAAVLRAVNMPEALFTPTFTASRIAGWTAHVLEQASDNRIYRPESLYKGEIPKQ